jgi:Spondin_N
MKRLLALAVVFAVVPSAADIVVENEPIVYDEIFDLEYAIEGVDSIYSERVAKYYCVFRSNWSKENHPAEFPQSARWSAPLLFSHTKQYYPALKNKEAPNGVEQLVEVRYFFPFGCTPLIIFDSTTYARR